VEEEKSLQRPGFFTVLILRASHPLKNSPHLAYTARHSAPPRLSVPDARWSVNILAQRQNTCITFCLLTSFRSDRLGHVTTRAHMCATTRWGLSMTYTVITSIVHIESTSQSGVKQCHLAVPQSLHRTNTEYENTCYDGFVSYMSAK